MRDGAMRCLFEASVAYGKSAAIEHLAESYSRAGKKVWVFSNRSAVVDQLAKLAAHLPGVVVMTIQAADRRRVELTSNPAHLILIDEVHMGGSAAQYGRVMDCAPNARIVAFTGTPKPETFDTFPCHVQGRGARWLTAQGYLSPIRYLCPNPLDLRRVAVKRGEYDEAQVVELLQERRIYADALETFRAHGLGVPTLGFCVNVKHAEATAEEFRKAGHRCDVLTGKDRPESVSEKIARLADGGLLFSVDKVSAGFDLPDLRVLLSLRPTKSEQLWVQQLGRVARAADGKPHGMVLDHVGNTLRLGTLTEERDWRNLEATQAQRLTDDGESLSVRTCDECFAAFEAGPTCCPYCDAPLAKDTRIPRAESVRLREMEAAEIEAARQAAKEERKRMGQTIPQLRAWLPSKGQGGAHRQAVIIMRKRLDKALRDGDVALEAFARDQLDRFGGRA
ncbi:MAG: DEAD/DEAH box helicase family protein [Paracoccus sp.]|nr:DEAD/DEAH box helicase family protein [Paracoccus sp. (in: a-proteobacteria)]